MPSSGPPRRRRLAAGTALAAVFVAVLLGVAAGSRRDEPARAMPANAAASAVVPMALAAPASTVGHGTDRPDGGDVRTAAAASTEEPQDPLCRLAQLPPEQAARHAAEASLPQPASVDRMSLALKAGITPEARALGDWLRDFDAQQRSEAATARDVDACGADEPCHQQAAREGANALRTLRRRAADRLAEAARDTRRPALYAMAVEACSALGAAEPDGPCRLITVDRWAQLDPGNLVAWMHVASRAAQRNDAAGVAEALHRVGVSTRSDFGAAPLGDQVEPALAGLPELERTKLLLQLVDLQGRWQLPDFRTLFTHCSERAVRDQNRRQVCDAAANALLDHGATMIERGLAIRLAGQLDWPAARQAALRQERDAMVSALGDEMRIGPALTCNGWTRFATTMDRSMRGGEIRVAREAMERSGRSVAELAERTTARRAQLAASAAAAASRSP